MQQPPEGETPATPPSPEAVPAPRKYSRIRVHWYMAAVVVEYVEDTVVGEETVTVARTKRMNAIVQSKDRPIVARTLEDVRNMVLYRATEQYGIKPEAISDYIITNMIHMGHMSEHEHFTKYRE